MFCTTIQNKIPTRQVSQYNIQMIFDPRRFADKLTELFLESRFKTQSALAAAAGLERSSVSAYMNARPQSITGKASQPTPETAAALAKALGANVDELLLLAGHAPRNEYEHGLFKGIEKLSPEKQTVVRQATHAMIEALSKEDEPDTNYID